MRAKVALFVFAGLSLGVSLSAGPVCAADAATEEARQHFLKGQQLFDVGRWDDAADEFEKAYATRGDPIFIYNMAQAYRRKGETKRALDLYKNYLMKAPKSPQREEVEERIRALQKQLEEAEYAVKPPAQGPANSPAPTSAPAPAPAPIPWPGPASPAPAGAPAQSGASPPVPVPWPPTASPAPAGASAPSGARASESAAYAPTSQPAPVAPSAAPTGPAAYAQPAVGIAPAQAGYSTTATAPVENYPAPVGPGTLQTQPSYLRTEATPAPTPGRGLRVVGVVCGAVGVAAIGAGIFFGAEAASYSRSVETASVFNPNFQDRGKLYENLQWVGYGVGAGLVATGAVLYGIGAVSARSSAVAVAPSVFPGGAGLGAQGVF